MQTCLYERFKVAHPDMEVKMRAFDGLRPYFVKACRERNMCCCRYHVELDMLRHGLLTLRDPRKGLHAVASCNCKCLVCTEVGDSCAAHLTVYDGITKMWEACVFPKDDTSDFHRLECLMGDCRECGGSTLPICRLETSDVDFQLKWKRFDAQVVGVGEDRAPKKRIGEVFMETGSAEFVAYLLPKIQEFITHNFVARW